ncbi:TlpA family protein disulfide reductase [Photobacterium sp. TY1-4]|uniref:TlpA family protein disulfide reductase n=1 Tax=Photobacterium sp. TY1-4 TaxID=2899122 RepID=UPI0021C0EF21|nr:TlpA disulfide reductase family protein [Photobacterium sp. TY1-4]UXI03567.1 TlpA family protein disulfide reductase [Photobacterium sp. TY1-4]
MIKKMTLLTLLLGGLLNTPFSYAFEDAYGKALSWQGQWKVVNYWAEWCGPCRREIPAFNQLSAELDGQVMMVGVNFDSLTGQALIETMERLNIRFPVLDEPSKIKANLPQPVVLPTTYIVNPQGEPVKMLVGEQSRQDIQKALAAAQSAT